MRFAKVRTCHDPKQAILEIGLFGMDGDADRAWAVTRQLLCSKASAVRKQGVAPKNAHERRIEATLKRLNVWAKQDRLDGRGELRDNPCVSHHKLIVAAGGVNSRRAHSLAPATCRLRTQHAQRSRAQARKLSRSGSIMRTVP